MVSTQIIPVLGLDVTVYGLTEYKLLAQRVTPVSIIFALHGRGQSKLSMESLSEALCRLNKKRKSCEPYLLVITFDSINHGSRYIHKISNCLWTGERRENPNFPIDMWNIINSSATTVSQLIDVIELYLLPSNKSSIVQVWGVTGFSAGGNSSFIAAANDPRITVAISINGSFDTHSVMHHQIKINKVPKEKHPPQHYWDILLRKKLEVLASIKSAHILILNAENDIIVPSSVNDPFIQNLRKVHSGIEGYDWKTCVVPGVGHEWPNTTMIEYSVDWVYQWMIKRLPESKL